MTASSHGHLLESLMRRSAMVALLAFAGCDPFHTEFAAVEPAELYRAREMHEAPSLVSELRVLDWNIKFGGARIDFFFDCFGDRVLMTRDEVIANLENLAAEIRALDPDIVILQEVDTNSKRAAYVNQLQWLLDHTDLNYGAYASQWRADFVPSDGLGPVDSGNAILSRWPIHNAERLALDLSQEQDWLTRYFYLRRNILRAAIDVPRQDNFWVLGIHTDAYGKDGTKRRHIDRLLSEMNALDDAGATVLAAGDLNTLPPGSDKQHDFPDTICEDEDYIADDYRGETTWLDALYAGYAPAIPLEDYQADNARYFSHTVDSRGSWNRTLDYLFTNASWTPASGVVHQDASYGGLDTMPLSDHAPVTSTLELP